MDEILRSIFGEQLLLLIIGFIAGPYMLAGAYFNWDWFMTASPAHYIVRIFGRTGARVFYGLIGLMLIGIAILTLFGVIE